MVQLFILPANADHSNFHPSQPPCSVEGRGVSAPDCTNSSFIGAAVPRCAFLVPFRNGTIVLIRSMSRISHLHTSRIHTFNLLTLHNYVILYFNFIPGLSLLVVLFPFLGKRKQFSIPLNHSTFQSISLSLSLFIICPDGFPFPVLRIPFFDSNCPDFW